MSTSDASSSSRSHEWPDEGVLRRLAEQALSSVAPGADPLSPALPSSSAWPRVGVSSGGAEPAAISQFQNLDIVGPSVATQSLGEAIPGAADLRALFATTPLAPAVPVGSAGASFDAVPSFYFLDRDVPRSTPVPVPEFDDAIVPAAPIDVHLIRGR